MVPAGPRGEEKTQRALGVRRKLRVLHKMQDDRQHSYNAINGQQTEICDIVTEVATLGCSAIARHLLRRVGSTNVRCNGHCCVRMGRMRDEPERAPDLYFSHSSSADPSGAKKFPVQNRSCIV